MLPVSAEIHSIKYSNFLDGSKQYIDSWDNFFRPKESVMTIEAVNKKILQVDEYTMLMITQEGE